MNIKIMPFGMLVVIVLVWACSVKGQQNDTKKVDFNPNVEADGSLSKTTYSGFALVELFTSEGCSSCPPADDAVADFAVEFPDNVIVLGWHVDYWDYLGWKDPFGSPEFSERQYVYGRHFKLSSNYTPQVVVNGETEFVGSSRGKLRSAIEKSLQVKSNEALSIRSAKTSDTGIDVVLSLSGTQAESKIGVALVRKSVISDVKRGENRGSILKHINVVEQFSSVDAQSTTLHFDHSAIKNKSDYQIIAFVQQVTTKQIEGVSKHNLD